MHRLSGRRTSPPSVAALLFLALLLPACSKNDDGPPRLQPFDAGFALIRDSGANLDAEVIRGDATAPNDASSLDAPAEDARSDAEPDTGPPDTGIARDAQPADAPPPPDSGPDVGFRDAGFLDARPRDADTRDAEPVDLGANADALPGADRMLDGGPGFDATACTGTLGGTDRCTVCGESTCCPELQACAANPVCRTEFNGCFASCTLSMPVSRCMALCFMTVEGQALRGCVRSRCTPPCS